MRGLRRDLLVSCSGNKVNANWYTVKEKELLDQRVEIVMATHFRIGILSYTNQRRQT